MVLAKVEVGKFATLIDFDINFEDRQRLKQLDDKVMDILVIFDSTLDTISNLLGKCEVLDPTSSTFTQTLSEQQREIELNKEKATALYKKVMATSQLVHL